MKGKGQWRRHDGGPSPTSHKRKFIQWRVIGSDQIRVAPAQSHDWSMFFEWRYAA